MIIDSKIDFLCCIEDRPLILQTNITASEHNKITK